jgi:ABC-type multidrug transport system fused ATPase/permease subunit
MALAVVIGVVALLRAGGSSQLAVMGPVLLLLVRALIYARQLQFATQSAIEMTPYAVGLDAEITEMLANPSSGGEREVHSLDHLEIDHISFAHVPGQFVLHDLSLSLPFGQVLGIAGPSGVGKSTLLQLLLRLRPPTSGRICVNGQDLSEISAASWASIVAFVPQDNKLIRGTIAENIAFLRPFDREAIEQAAELANLRHEVLALPQGFDTEVGPGARDLSGGQKQRLGIARALVGAPELLILDEPTSALDPTSEGLITRTIATLRGSTTVVIVAHRTETLAVCDRVIHLTRVAADQATANAAPGADDVASDGFAERVAPSVGAVR